MPGAAPCRCRPTDPLFIDIQQRFLKEQAAMYGADHLYSADPFNEIAPPSWEPEYLAKVSSTIYQSMAGGDPDATWHLMSWNFFFDEQWTPPRLKSLTLAVPKGRMIYLDYVCEQTEFFRKSENFHGAPFVWCVVGNFGGTTNYVAPLDVIANRMTAALPVANCRGIGTTYYMGRWREFIQRVEQALATGTTFDEAAYQKWRVAADGRWVTSTQSAFPVRPDGDPTATATRLMAKYRPDLVVPR